MNFSQKIQSNPWFSHLLLGVCAIFILGGIVNTGVTGFFLAIPFVVLFAYVFHKVSQKKQILWILILVVVYIPFVFHRETNILFFPYIGAEIEFQPGASCVLFEFNSQYCNQKNEKGNPILDRPVKATIVSFQIGHPDLTKTIEPTIRDSEGHVYSTDASFIADGLRKGTIKSDRLKNLKRWDKFESRWTRALGDLVFWPWPPLMIQMIFLDLQE